MTRNQLLNKVLMDISIARMSDLHMNPRPLILACALACLPSTARTAGTTADQDHPATPTSAGGSPAPSRSANTDADGSSRRSDTLQAMQSIMGLWPGDEARCPLNVMLISEEDLPDLIRRRISFEAIPGHRVPAYLLIPKTALAPGAQTWGALTLHQTHAAGNKVVVGLGNSPDDEYGLELARRGFVCIAPPYPMLADYWPDIKQLGFKSGTLLGAWINSRALDVLASMPFVRTNAYASIGHSLGGHNGIFTAAFDSRIRVTVSSCGLDRFKDYYNGDPRNWAPERGWCQTRYMPALAAYQGRLGDIPFDFPDVVAALAPRAVFISAPLGDSNFRWKSVEEIVKLAKPEFARHNASTWIKDINPASAHSFPAEVRKQAYDWIEFALNSPLPSRTQAAAKPKEPAQPFKVSEDLLWEQVLGEPEIAQPVSLTFDERGRMWVVEYRQYPHPAGLRMLSRDQFWRAVYDRVPRPPPHHDRGADRITIHEDTDGDGQYDRHKVFQDGLNIVTSVCHGRGGVWVLNPPFLLFYPDANQDDIPDSDPRVHLSGFGLEDTHSVVNSLRWGPDGWLYGAQGSTVSAEILRPGLDAHPIARTMGQQIWRYHPESRRFETFSEGGGNAFGCELDDAGRIFSGHNGGNTRGFHYMQGAFLQKGFDKHGPLSNPYAFGFFPPMSHNDVERFTHTFVIESGSNLPERFKGTLLGVEPLQGRIVHSSIQPDRSTFLTRDLSHPVAGGDPWFKPVDIKQGPDGALYICDWHDKQVNHFRNHEGQIDASNGRVYRLRGRKASVGNSIDLRKETSSGLVSLLAHTNRWYRQTALRLIADRQDQTLIPILRHQTLQARGQHAIESLWALHLSGGLDPETARALLSHSEAQCRLWTIRLMSDAVDAGGGFAAAVGSMLVSEPNLEVRCQAASSAQRLGVENALSWLDPLIRRDADTQDPRQPLLIWWALESHLRRDPSRVLKLFDDSTLWDQPLANDHLLHRLCRRLAQPGGRSNLLAVARLFQTAPSPQTSSRLMQGLEEAYQGRPMSGFPPELVGALARHHATSPTLALRQGKPEALEQALRVLEDRSAPEARRLEILGILADLKASSALTTVIRVLQNSSGKEAALRHAALSAIQTFDTPDTASQLAPLLTRLDPETQATAQHILASRRSWAPVLLSEIESGRLKRQSVDSSVVGRLRSFREPELQSRVEALWGNTRRALPAEMESRIVEIGRMIATGTGEPYSGREVFAQACAGCHKLFGRGREIGPDLTPYRRSDLATLLLNIVNPSAEIREGYESWAIETRDDRMLSGHLLDQDASSVVLRGLDGSDVRLRREEIETLRRGSMSLMPEGLLDGLTDQQLRDLFAYLRSSQPLVGDRAPASTRSN